MKSPAQVDPVILERRRARATNAWQGVEDIILVGAGMPISIPGGADQTFPFHTHPEYFWLTGRHREGGVLAYHPQEGWALFEPVLSKSEQVWGGSEAPIGRPVEELELWLKERQPSNVRWLGVPKEAESDAELRFKLTHARRPKDENEIAYMEQAVRATAAGHATARTYIKAGISEREVQIEIEAAMFRAGAETLGYETIVGSAINGTRLHSMPSARKMQTGELVVVDAGGAVNGYTADVTRTHAVDGAWKPGVRAIYDAVLHAQERVIEACVIGTEWCELHLLAARTLAGSLAQLGIIHCTPEEAIETELIALFFPHGIGHMVGLGVRDAGGPLPGRDSAKKYAGITIRMDLPLEDGYLVTVEPGLYFNSALLNDPKNREKYNHAVNWKLIEPWVDEVGVRIEDNILVTRSGPRNLTCEIPK